MKICSSEIVNERTRPPETVDFRGRTQPLQLELLQHRIHPSHFESIDDHLLDGFPTLLLFQFDKGMLDHVRAGLYCTVGFVPFWM